MKPAPNYWWDFVDDDMKIIVQSDYEGGERLAECSTIEEAEKLIEDYKTGRKTPNWNNGKKP